MYRSFFEVDMADRVTETRQHCDAMKLKRFFGPIKHRDWIRYRFILYLLALLFAVGALRIAFAPRRLPLKKATSKLCAEGDYCVDVDLSPATMTPLSPVHQGIFFEEINHSGEGGLLVEILRDPSFEGLAFLDKHPERADISAWKMETKPWGRAPPATRAAHNLQKLSQDPNTVASQAMRDKAAWQFKQGMQVEISEHNSWRQFLDFDTPLHAVCAMSDSPEDGYIINTGHSLSGFYVEDGASYRLRAKLKGDPVDLHVLITSADGKTVLSSGVATHEHAQHEVEWTQKGEGEKWEVVSTTLKVQGSRKDARLVLKWPGRKRLCFDWVSLMPEDAWGKDGSLFPFNRKLLEVIKALKPQFLRFPGGAYVEGTDLDTAYKWKSGVGPAEERPGHPNANWGYWSSDKLGVHEFFWLAQELDAEPVWVINVGISQAESVSPEGLQPWIQDAMDGLEFIMGDKTTRWGKVRAMMGRETPWKLNYITLGNEECLRPWYLENYKRFYKTIRKTYSHLKFIANCDLGRSASFDMWEFHSYKDPTKTWELRAAIDEYQGRPIAVTEFAAMTESETVIAAIAEAGFMTAMERNCDKVHMTAYAPLFGHQSLRTWKPDLIVFNESSHWYGTPSFVVQKAFRDSLGSHCVNLMRGGPAAPNVEVSATCSDTDCQKVYIKLVNYQDKKANINIALVRTRPWYRFGGFEPLPKTLYHVQRTELYTANPQGDNHSWTQPNLLSPLKTSLDFASDGTVVALAPWSLTVLEMKR